MTPLQAAFPPDDLEQLEDAARRAAAVGTKAMRKAREDVLEIAQVLRALEQDAHRVSVGAPSTPAQRAFGEIHAKLVHLVRRAVPGMEDPAEARAKTVGRFRIVAFGWTHTGKSTLNEAMVRGDGATVSDGRTGFTREAHVYTTGHLDVVDLPGIEAFGAGGAEDERVAEQEVVAADPVLLCFDVRAESHRTNESASRTSFTGTSARLTSSSEGRVRATSSGITFLSLEFPDAEAMR